MSTTRKTALVTGASGGIGASIARAAGRQGYHVVLLDLPSQALEQTAASIAGAQAFACDVTDAEAVGRVLDQLAEPPGLLVNNAGIVKFCPILDIDVSDWRRILDVDLTGAFIMAQAVARRLRDAGRPGCIVNISSIGGITPSLGTNAYAAGKAGLCKLTELMALELGPLGIRINTVSPGFIDGGMSASVYADPRTREIRTNAVPLKRLGSEDDIANAVMFLTSDAASYVNGHNLVVDGGVVPSALFQVPRG